MSSLCWVHSGIRRKLFLWMECIRGVSQRLVFAKMISQPDWQELIGNKDISLEEGDCFIDLILPILCPRFLCLNHYFSTATVLCKAYRGGHLTIRLALGGCTNRPFYRIVAAHNKCPRDGRFVEQLGSYDPLPNSHGEKLVALNLDRIRHWIGCGAHLSKPVEKLLGLSGFFPLHPMMITNAERLRRKRAREVLLASQETETEAAETKANWLQWA